MVRAGASILMFFGAACATLEIGGGAVSNVKVFEN